MVDTKFEAAGLIPAKKMIKQLFRANVKYGGRQVKRWVGGARGVVPGSGNREGSAGGAELVLGLIGGQAEPRGSESMWSQGDTAKPLSGFKQRPSVRIFTHNTTTEEVAR